MTVDYFFYKISASLRYEEILDLVSGPRVGYTGRDEDRKVFLLMGAVIGGAKAPKRAEWHAREADRVHAGTIKWVDTIPSKIKGQIG